MDWTQIIVSVLGAIISSLVGWLLKIKLNDDQRAQLKLALETGVAAAAERFKDGSGGQKHQVALHAAESLAPKAMAKLNPEQKSLLVDATYARLKPTLNTSYVHHGDGLAQPVDIIAPLPRPPAVPDLPAADTPLERPRGSR